MTTRAEYDGDALARQVIVGAQHVVVALDLMVDVVYARPASRREGNRVMYGVDPHQRDVSDTVADTRIADLRPKSLISHRIGGEQTYMRKTRDARVPGCKVALAATFRSNHQFDVVAGRVFEADKCLH